jgi:hypothetical protein
LIRNGNCHGAITAITLSDIASIQSGIRIDLLYDTFQRLRDFLDIAELHSKAIDHALDQKLHDIEDGFQLAAAIHWNATHLITRNGKDFPKNTGVKVQTPTEYLSEN